MRKIGLLLTILILIFSFFTSFSLIKSRTYLYAQGPPPTSTPADLTITSASACITSGNAIQYTATVRNQGATIASNFVVRGAVNSGGWLYATTNIGSLPAGNSTTVSWSSSSYSQGVINNITAWDILADSTNVVTEISEVNNTWTSGSPPGQCSPTPTPSVDLIIENYSACTFSTGQPYPNDRAGNYSYTIKNEGTSQSPPSEALVNFQPFPYEAADSTSIPALNPGQSYPVSGVVDFNICTTCPYVNTHFFADFGQSIVETDETNNVRNMITDTCSGAPTPTPTPGLPDLVVQNLSNVSCYYDVVVDPLDMQTYSRTNVTFDATVQNQGGSDAGSTNDLGRMYDSSQNMVNAANGYFPALAASQTTVIPYLVRYWYGFLPNGYVDYKVDAGSDISVDWGNILESDETNNISSKYPFTCGASPTPPATVTLPPGGWYFRGNDYLTGTSNWVGGGTISLYGKNGVPNPSSYGTFISSDTPTTTERCSAGQTCNWRVDAPSSPCYRYYSMVKTTNPSGYSSSSASSPGTVGSADWIYYDFGSSCNQGSRGYYYNNNFFVSPEACRISNVDASDYTYSDRISLSWQINGGADPNFDHILVRREGADYMSLGKTSTSFTDVTGCSQGYFYRTFCAKSDGSVIAGSGPYTPPPETAGDAADNGYSQICPTPPPPPSGCFVSAPTSYTASRVTPDTVDLDFNDNATNETGFRIQRKSGATCASLGAFSPWTTRGASPGIGLVGTPEDTAASVAQCWQWQVQAYNSSCSSTWALSNTVTPTPTLGPSTPTPTPTNTPTPTLTPTPAPAPGWFQTLGGNAYSAGGITSLVPSGETFNTNINNLASEGVSYSDTISVGSGNAGKNADSTAFPELLTYAELLNRFDDIKTPAGGSPFNPSKLTSGSGSIGNTVAYEVTGDISLEDWTGFSGNAVIFVNGNITISENVTVSNGSFLGFVVSGNISVNSSVTIVEGFYFTNGTFSTGTGGTALALKGTFVADNFNLQRNLGSDNSTIPAETFNYRPDFAFTAPLELRRPYRHFQEVAP